MSDTQHNKNSEQTKKNPLNSTELCVGCMQFFGNPQHQNLCSQCFKQELAKQQEAQGSKESQQQVMQNEEQKKDEIKQKDTGHCWKCNKKVGYFGYQCKCLYTFCKAHRLPENHDCGFDFKELENAKLKKLNPQLLHQKLEKI